MHILTINISTNKCT